MSKLDPKAWINLEKARVLLLDDHAEGLNILVQIITAFGVRRFYRCATFAEAQEVASHEEVHLIVVNANLKESPAYDFVTWLRRADIQNAFAPVVLVTGHTQRSNVERARDCGANVVLAKPVSPMAVLERIIWIAREKKPFVRCGNYIGPDRRFRDSPPPGGVGRRQSDKAQAAPAEEADAAAASPSPRTNDEAA